MAMSRALLLLLCSAPSHGFELLYSTTPKSSDKCAAILAKARYRWDNNDLSFKNTRTASGAGDVGLGGGIEYALHPTFCSRMVMQFREYGYGSSINCSGVERGVEAALDLWSDRHPAIYFTRVAFTKDAELIIGAQSRTVIKAMQDAQRYKEWMAGPDLRDAMAGDELGGVALHDR